VKLNKKNEHMNLCACELYSMFISTIVDPTTTTDIVDLVVPIATPSREFKGHEGSVSAVAMFPDGCRMVTGSFDKTVCLWDLKNGAVLKKMDGHGSEVMALAVSRDGKLIASGDEKGGLMGWDGDTGQSLTQGQAIVGHSGRISSLDFSPCNTVLATVSWDEKVKFWRDASSWTIQGNPIHASGRIYCVRYSPSGEHLAIATFQYI